MKNLPPMIQEIIRLIGYTKTMELVREFGGQELRIPKTDEGDAWAALSEVIGLRAMKILANEFGGEMLYIALCDKAVRADRSRRMISRYDTLLSNGHSGRAAVSILVKEFGPISYRQVEKIINSPLPTPSLVIAQGELF